jgi:hypothetical protein
MRIDSLAKLSIGINLLHLFLSLAFRKQFLPTTSPAFPNYVQILFGVEFGLAGLVVTKVLDRIISSKAKQSNVEDLSVTSTRTIPLQGIKSISASDWRWAIAVATFFLCLCATLFSLHPPKFVQ